MKVIGPSTGMPFAVDFDGDGKADPATWDSATQIFRWKSSGSGYSPAMKVLGPSTGIPLVGFFDGDNKADPATWDPDTKILRWKESGNSYAPSSLSERTLSDKTAYHKPVETMENHLFTTRRLSIIRLLRQAARSKVIGPSTGVPTN